MASLGNIVNNYNLKDSSASLAGLKDQAEQNQEKLKALLLGKQKEADVQNSINQHRGESDVDVGEAKKYMDMAQGNTSAARDAAGNPMKVSTQVGKGGATVMNSDIMPPGIASAGNRVSMQTKRLGDAAKNDIGGLSDQMNTLNLYHQMLDDPNKFDQKKLQVLGARLVEGKGQRLLDSVIQAMGADKGTLAGDAQSKLNYLTGRAQAGLTEEQMKAMRETALKYQDDLMPQYEDARDKFHAYAPSLAPDVAATGSLDSIVGAHLQLPDRLAKELAARKEKFAQQQKVAATAPQVGPANSAPASAMDKIAMWLKGKSAPASMAAPAPDTAGAGGMNDIMKRAQEELAKRKAGR